MPPAIPDWLDPTPWLRIARSATAAQARAALECDAPAETELAALLSPAGAALLEPMAQHAQALTRRHFGRTVSLFIPLYLSDYCAGGCLYCGFAADRKTPRRRLSLADVAAELRTIKRMGLDEILLLTGERSRQAGVRYLEQCVALAARSFHKVTLEVFPMRVPEYRRMAAAGATGVTLYQETYDPTQYEAMHRWGPKQDYRKRVEAPSRLLSAGLRFAGLGVLLGIADPVADALALFRHARFLQRAYWRAGISISFPRVCAQSGDFTPPFPVGERQLAQIVFAFRICLPDVPLVLSTREAPQFRDGMAGIGISKMSVASRTTVGGYEAHAASPDGQFHVNDDRDVAACCAALRARGLEPVFKDWESIYR